MKYFYRFQREIVGIVGMVLSVGIVPFAYAASPSLGITKMSQLSSKLFCPVFNAMFYVLVSLAVIMVIFAAYNYLTSQGDSEKVGKATKTITFAAVALVVALIAKTVPLIVGDIFGLGSTGLAFC